jgi:hypothetical protein
MPTHLIHFINPRTDSLTTRPLYMNRALYSPLAGLLAVAASIPRERYEVILTDENIEPVDFDIKADLVGLSAMTSYVKRGYEIADRFTPESGLCRHVGRRGAILDSLAARLLAGPQLMDRGGYAGAASQRIFQIDRAAVLLQEIAERLIGELLKIFHLVVPEQVELPPDLFVELQAFARHL